VESDYVSISNEYLETLKDDTTVTIDNEHIIDFHKYLVENKYGIKEEDKEMLEKVVIRGIPDNQRRRYWLSVSGAFGYLKNYSPGYYATLSSEDEQCYPNWPHPDYTQINKDI
jgi:hypothetical protein